MFKTNLVSVLLLLSLSTYSQTTCENDKSYGQLIIDVFYAPVQPTFEESITKLNQAIEHCKNRECWGDYAYTKSLKAQYLIGKRKLDKVESLLKEADQLIAKYGHYYTREGDKVFVENKQVINWAFYHYLLGSYEKLEKSEDLEMETNDEKKLMIEYFLMQGGLKNKQKRYKEAIKYYEKAIKLAKEIKALKFEIDGHKLRGDAHKDAAEKTLVGALRLEKAKKDYYKALEINRKYLAQQPLKGAEIDPHRYRREMLIYEGLSGLNLQLGNFPQALSYLEKSEKSAKEHDPAYRDELIVKFGDLFYSFEDYDQAIAYYSDDLNRRLGKEKENQFFIALLYTKLGKANLAKRESTKAYNFSRQAEETISLITETETKTIALIELNKLKGNIYKYKGEKKEALAYYKRALTNIEALKTKYDIDDDKAILVSNNNELFDNAIETAFELKGAYLEEAFRFSEKEKGIKLLETLKLSSFDTKDNYIEVPSIGEIQANITDEKTALIEYYVSSNQVLYSWYITKNEFKASQTLLSPEWETNIQGLISLMVNNDGSRESKGSLEKLANTSHFLYQELLGEMPLDASLQELIIIPDEAIKLVPFDILSKEAMDLPNHHNYLIQKYAVSYANSATILQRQLDTESGSANRSYGAFMAEDPCNPEQLDGLEQSLTDAAKTWGEKPYSKTTNSIFRQESGNFNIIAIVAHTSINIENPLYSYFIFAPEENKPCKDKKNRILTFSDIYQLKLNAKLAIMFNCEAAKDSLFTDEALAYAFNYANIQSFIAPIWKIPDTESGEINTYLNQYLLNGEKKPQALRKAKLDYLKAYEGRDKTLLHPYFWASFVQYGNPKSVTETSSFWSPLAKWFGGGLFIIFSLYFLKNQGNKSAEKREGN